MPSLNIAVVGASGSDSAFSVNVGGKLAKELVSNGAIVRVLAREESIDKPALQDLHTRGVAIVAVDYKAPVTVERALSGVDIVVSTLSGEGYKNQRVVVDVCKKLGTKLFVPSSWGNRTTSEPDDSPLVDRRHAIEHLKAEYVPSLLIFHGPFQEILPHFVGPKDGRIVLPGGGQAEMGSTSIEDVVKYTAHVLTHVPIEQLQGRELVLEGSKQTWAHFAEIYKARDPSIIVESDHDLEGYHTRGAAGNFADYLVWKWHTEGRGRDGSEAQIEEARALYPSMTWRDAVQAL